MSSTFEELGNEELLVEYRKCLRALYQSQDSSAMRHSLRAGLLFTELLRRLKERDELAAENVELKKPLSNDQQALSDFS